MGGFSQFFISLFGLISSVLYWAGGWGLLDTYVLPDQPLASLWVTATFGILGMMVWRTSPAHSSPTTGWPLTFLVLENMIISMRGSHDTEGDHSNNELCCNKNCTEQKK